MGLSVFELEFGYAKIAGFRNVMGQNPHHDNRCPLPGDSYQPTSHQTKF